MREEGGRQAGYEGGGREGKHRRKQRKKEGGKYIMMVSCQDPQVCLPA